MIKLYLDEDVPEAIAVAMKLRGFDVLTTREAGRKGLTDREQLDFAHSVKRVLFTHNIADFVKIHIKCLKKEKDHSGIILSKQLPIGVMVKALSKLLSSSGSTSIQNQVIWLSDWIK